MCRAQAALRKEARDAIQEPALRSDFCSSPWSQRRPSRFFTTSKSRRSSREAPPTRPRSTSWSRPSGTARTRCTGHSVLTFDATGALDRHVHVRGPVPNDANQMTMLVATADAAAIFDLTADLAMTAGALAARRKGLLGRLHSRRLRRVGQLHGRARPAWGPRSTRASASSRATLCRRRLDICMVRRAPRRLRRHR